MKAFRCLRASLVACATWSLFIPAHLFAAEDRPVESPDVQLTNTRQLIGQYVDADGQPMADQSLELRRGMRAVGETRTDADGRFTFQGLQGGVYQVVAADQVIACRCWAPHTAPPNASEQLMVVASDEVNRGQRPFSEIFANPLVIGALIAGAIAIPIAIHNSGDDDDGS